MIYYYDSSKTNIDTFKKRKDIKTILVSNKTQNPISKNMPAYYYVTMFHKKYPKNKYAKCMLDTPPVKPTKKIHIGNTVCSRCNIYTGSGLTIDEIKKIAKQKAKVVIFEWDLTISVCKGGIFIPRLTFSNEFVFPKNMDYSMDEIAHFYAGTLERYEEIKNMFKQLRENKTKIFILTNNQWATIPNEFAKILKSYDPQIEAENIIYGNNNKISTINKHYFLKNKTNKRSNSWFQNVTRKLFKL
jgi:hypothetical protein